MPLAQISLTLSRHFSLSFIASGRSSGLHPVSSHCCCMFVRAGLPAFAWPYAGVHSSTSLMSSSLLLQQCPACLVCLTCIVFVMGDDNISLIVSVCCDSWINIAIRMSLWFSSSFYLFAYYMQKPQSMQWLLQFMNQYIEIKNKKFVCNHFYIWYKGSTSLFNEIGIPFFWVTRMDIDV